MAERQGGAAAEPVVSAGGDPRLECLHRSANRRCGPGDAFVCEGRFAVEAMLDSGGIDPALVVIEDGRHEDLAARIASDHPAVALVRLPGPEVARVAGFGFHRGVLAAGTVPPACSLTDWRRGTPAGRFARRISVACGLADSANLGALVRNAAAFGFDAVVVAESHGASPWTPKAIRASAGTIFRIPVLASPDLAGDLEDLAADRWRVVAAVASPGADPLEDFDGGDDPVAIVLGNEGRGLDDEWLARCSEGVRIPLAGGVDSLNVASASAILHHHLRRGDGRSG